MDQWNVRERMKRERIPGLSMAFIEDGSICRPETLGEQAVEGGEPVRADTMFNACSISKFAASLLALVLVEERILRLDEKVNERLASWKVPRHPEFEAGNVTLRRLLGHQAGFSDPDGSFQPLTRNRETPSMTRLLKGLTPYRREPALLIAEPGSRFIYSDTGFCVIQLLIEDATGETFEAMMREKIFGPLHMNNSRFVMHESDMPAGLAAGHNQHGERLAGPHCIYPFAAAAGLWTTPTDLAVLITELMASLHGKGKLGLSAATAEEMLRPQGGFEWAGLGIFMDRTGGRLELSSLGWGTGFQCMMTAYPEEGLGAVLMMNADPGVHQAESLLGYVTKMWQQEKFG